MMRTTTTTTTTKQITTNTWMSTPSTEFLLFCPDTKHCHSELNSAIKIGSDFISSGGKAWNLDGIFDSDFTLNNHIISICKVANYQLYRISHIRKYLTRDALKAVSPLDSHTTATLTYDFQFWQISCILLTLRSLAYSPQLVVSRWPMLADTPYHPWVIRKIK